MFATKIEGQEFFVFQFSKIRFNVNSTCFVRSVGGLQLGKFALLGGLGLKWKNKSVLRKDFCFQKKDFQNLKLK